MCGAVPTSHEGGVRGYTMSSACMPVLKRITIRYVLKRINTLSDIVDLPNLQL